MKKLFIAFLLITNQSYGQNNNITISGNIKGIGNDTVYVWKYLMSDIDNIVKDTIFAKSDKFIYRTFLAESAAIAIIPNSSFIKRISGRNYMPQGRFIELFVSPKDNLKISGKLEPYYIDYSVKGGLLNTEYAIRRNDFKNPEIEVAKIELRRDSLSVFPEKKEESNKLFDERLKKQSEVTTIKLKFIKNNLNNDISAYYLSRLSLDTFAKYYPMLSENVRLGFFKEVLINQYETYLKYIAAKKAEKELEKGSLVPDFQLKNIDGQNYSLSNFKGKFIVLDFWGTWCGPCIAEMPKLKATHKAFKDKVTFIGIACNDTIEAIKKAIKVHQIDWLQLVNTNENDVSVLYGVQAYPTKIILDENLKFIKRFVGMDEDFYKLLEDLTK
ncbi:MAG TPA: hypothetical protein DCQ50_04365 [Chryseobacterium sp.]|nr:hypothetical protein [Chryseobacterium sp.]